MGIFKFERWKFETSHLEIMSVEILSIAHIRSNHSWQKRHLHAGIYLFVAEKVPNKSLLW